MQITPIPITNQNMTFKHKYKVNPKNKSLEIIEDKVLGENPVLRLWNKNNTFTEYKMMYNRCRNFFVTHTLHNISGVIDYSVYFQDTEKEDLKDGKLYQINLDKLYNNAKINNTNSANNIYSLKNGEVTAKVFYDDNQERHKTDDTIIDEPTIVIKNFIYPQENIITNPNVIGIFSSDELMHTLCHLGTQLRNNTKICGYIDNKEVLEQLKNLNWQYAHIKLNDNYIHIEPCGKEFLSEPIKYHQVKPVKLDFCDEILTSDEYRPNLVGAKAYNLHRLETMVKDKKINVKIPPSIALPYGFIDKQINYDNYDEKQMNVIIEKLKQNHIDSTSIKIRSAYNDEDLPDFSCAGIHNSSFARIEPEDIYDAIYHCLYNDDYTWSYLENYGIRKEDVKPSIIIQSKVTPDYKFTLYTKYNDKLRIEFALSESDYYYGNIYILEYDRDSGKLVDSYKHFANHPDSVEYDENMNEVDILKDTSLLDKFNELVKNAMIIEKEFGHPQDIEGGLVGDNIWLWQTRNIVE